MNDLIEARTKAQELIEILDRYGMTHAVDLVKSADMLLACSLTYNELVQEALKNSFHTAFFYHDLEDGWYCIKKLDGTTVEGSWLYVSHQVLPGEGVIWGGTPHYMPICFDPITKYWQKPVDTKSKPK